MSLIDAIRNAMQQRDSRSQAADRCPVCGEPVAADAERVRAWPGKYAHRACGSYVRRSHRRGHSSQRIHQKFTRT